jgi:hypothetical protein
MYYTQPSMVIDFFAVNQDSYLSLNMGKEEKKELGLSTSFIVTVQKTHYLIVWVILQLIVLLIMMLLLYNVQIQVCIYLIVWGDSSVDCTSDNDVVAVQCTNTGLYLEHHKNEEKMFSIKYMFSFPQSTLI